MLLRGFSHLILTEGATLGAVLFSHSPVRCTVALVAVLSVIVGGLRFKASLLRKSEDDEIAFDWIRGDREGILETARKVTRLSLATNAV